MEQETLKSDQSVSLSLLSYGYHIHPQSKLYKYRFEYINTADCNSVVGA